MKRPYRYIIATAVVLLAVWAGYCVFFRPVSRRGNMVVCSEEGGLLEVEYELTIYKNQIEVSGTFPRFIIQAASKAEGKVRMEGTEYLCEKIYIAAGGGCFFYLPDSGSTECGIWVYLEKNFQVSSLQMGGKTYYRQQ